jgi:hypothetical protein
MAGILTGLAPLAPPESRPAHGSAPRLGALRRGGTVFTDHLGTVFPDHLHVRRPAPPIRELGRPDRARSRCAPSSIPPSPRSSGTSTARPSKWRTTPTPSGGSSSPASTSSGPASSTAAPPRVPCACWCSGRRPARGNPGAQAWPRSPRRSAMILGPWLSSARQSTPTGTTSSPSTRTWLSCRGLSSSQSPTTRPIHSRWLESSWPLQPRSTLCAN